MQRLTQLKTDKQWLLIIVLLSVGLRVGAAFYLGNEVENLPGTFDQVSYDMLARQLLAGEGFTVSTAWWPATPAGEPTAHWSYLYTLYLTAVYGLVGYQPLIARLLQAVVAGVLMPWLLYRLGRRFFNGKVGLAAAALAAFYIYFVYYAAALMTETFYIVGVLGVLDLATRLGQKPTEEQPSVDLRLYWLGFGLVLGLTILLRQAFMLFVPFIFLWLLWRSYWDRVQPFWPMLATLVGAGLVVVSMIIPWTIRNYQAFDTFVLLNTNAGYVFFWGNHPLHGYNFISILPADGPSYQDLIPAELRSLNEAELDRALLQRGLAFIAEDPIRYAILSLSRVKDYFKFWPSADSGLISNVSRVFSFGVLLPFMVYGLFRSLRQEIFSERFIIYLFIVIYTGIHLLTWSLIRYRLPVDVVLLIFAGVALVELQAKLTGRLSQNQKIYSPTPLHSSD